MRKEKAGIQTDQELNSEVCMPIIGCHHLASDPGECTTNPKDQQPNHRSTHWGLRGGVVTLHNKAILVLVVSTLHVSDDTLVANIQTVKCLVTVPKIGSITGIVILFRQPLLPATHC